MNRVLLHFFGLIIATFCFSAYSGSTYYLITHGSQDPYWNTLFQGAKAAAKDLQVNLQILAPAGANDIAKQVQFLNSAIATHPQGIATTIPSDSAFAKSLQQAKQINIPIVAFDTKPKDKEKNPYFAYIGSDNESMGESAATRAYKLKGIKQRVAILNPQPGHVGLEARAKGIKRILEAKNIKVDELDVGTDVSQAQTRIKSYIQRYPDVTAFFCLTSQSLDSLGQMLLHREQNGLTLNPHVFSFDKTPNTVHYLNKGIVDFAMDQQPFLMGYLSVTQLVLLKKHHVTPVDVNTAN